MLQEVCRKQINVSKFEDCIVSWQNSIFTLRGNKNIHLMDISYNLQSIEKTLDLNESTVTCNYASPLPKNFLVHYAAEGMTNLELVEMITNPAFWSHNIQLAQEMTNVVAYRWSPENLINNHECLLATVNSTGNIDFYASRKQIWSSIMDFSNEMKMYLQDEYENLLNCSKDFIDIQKAVYKIHVNTVIWAPELNVDNSCYFVTAQKSGEILFWNIKYDNVKLQTKLCGRIKNMSGAEVVTLLWIPISAQKFLLVISNDVGQVLAHHCEVVNGSIISSQQNILWSHKDRMLVVYVEYIMDHDNLFLFFNKHRHFVMQLYDTSLNLLSQCINNINDNKISSIIKKQNVMYVCTVNVKLYEVKYLCKNDEITVVFKLLETKDSYSTYELCGLSLSHNRSILALTLIDRKVLYRQKTLKIDVAFLCPENDLEVLAANIINNPEKKLTYIWDQVEVFRCKVIKTKKLPNLDYNKLLEESVADIYKLKCYLICLNFYINLEKSMSPNIIEPLPEMSMDVVKDKILLLHATTVLKKKYQKHEINKQLTIFDKETIDGCKKFIHDFCKKYSMCPTDCVSEDILNAPNDCIKYVCQGCDEEINSFSCSSGHLNMYCSMTFTAIEDDNYLVCKGCGATARIELKDERPTCVFCDLYLSNSCLPI